MNIMQCMQPNFLLTCQVYPMLMSSVPQAWGILERKSALFKLIVNFFLKGVVFMFWHDNVYIELVYSVTNFELVWTWNKVTVVENAKKVSTVPHLPYCEKNNRCLLLHMNRCSRTQQWTDFIFLSILASKNSYFTKSENSDCFCEDIINKQIFTTFG